MMGGDMDMDMNNRHCIAARSPIRLLYPDDQNNAEGRQAGRRSLKQSA
ncbi:hypothetical protein NC796_04930 [Aliifodinibius sp. S!AR15-10]|nr:hypothetical protein [Aliifodinibius sp. S!AR15-10]MDR8390475.1 hypothetical protein [Aliifodinibius sp. S!AR15-10]